RLRSLSVSISVPLGSSLFPSTTLFRSRLYEIFDEPEPVCDREGALPITNPQGALEFRDVHFAFGARPDELGRKVLRGVNLLIERSEERTSELQSHLNLVCRLVVEKKRT